MAPMNDPPATTWQVVSQSQRVKADQSGGVVEGYDVLFQTGQGHGGTVFVPLARYQPEHVRELIAAQAALLDAVGALNSGS